MDSSNEARHSTAHYFLEGLNEIGFDYLFCNFGTDHAPLIEAMAQLQARRPQAPTTILCPHENTAVHMAAGYALATGRGQGVMVHVDAGTANSAMALHNLCRARIPVLLMAGKAPYTTRGELWARATPTCISCRSRSTRRASCGPTPSGSTTCRPAWSPRRRCAARTGHGERSQAAGLLAFRARP